MAAATTLQKPQARRRASSVADAEIQRHTQFAQSPWGRYMSCCSACPGCTAVVTVASPGRRQQPRQRTPARGCGSSRSVPHHDCGLSAHAFNTRVRAAHGDISASALMSPCRACATPRRAVRSGDNTASAGATTPPRHHATMPRHALLSVVRLPPQHAAACPVLRFRLLLGYRRRDARPGQPQPNPCGRPPPHHHRQLHAQLPTPETNHSSSHPHADLPRLAIPSSATHTTLTPLPRLVPQPASNTRPDRTQRQPPTLSTLTRNEREAGPRSAPQTTDTHGDVYLSPALRYTTLSRTRNTCSHNSQVPPLWLSTRIYLLYICLPRICGRYSMAAEAEAVAT